MQVSCNWVLAALLAAAAAAHAQDFTQPSGTVGRGAVQIETSTILSDGAAGLTLSGPGPLIRFGITDRLEVRAGSAGIQHGFGAAGVTGAADPALSFMYRLAAESAVLPEISVIGALSLPFGSASLTSAGYDPGMTIAWTKQLPRGFDAAGNLSLGWVTAEDGRIAAHSQSVAVGRGIGRGFRAYTELYRMAPAGCGHAALWAANMGFTRDTGKDRGIDIEFGRTFAGGIPGWSVIVGFTMRLPNGVRR